MKTNSTQVHANMHGCRPFVCSSSVATAPLPFDVVSKSCSAGAAAAAISVVPSRCSRMRSSRTRVAAICQSTGGSSALRFDFTVMQLSW